MARSPDFRLALVGAGRMGRHHLRALADNPAAAITHVVDPVPAARAAVATTGLPVYPSVPDLLAETTPDGLLVTTPTSQHGALVAIAAKAGLPVLCEKPAGLTAAEAQEAGRVAAEAGIAFQVAYWRRFVPSLQRLRDRIAAGAMGDVLFVAALQWDGEPPAAGFRTGSGGIFVDMGVHEFDQIQWLTGERVDRVATQHARHVTDPAVSGHDVDSAQALLGLSGGGTALVALGRHHRGGDMAAVEVFGTRDHERLTFLDPADGDATMHAALARQAEDFVELVRSGRSTGAGVADAVAVLDAAYQATAGVTLSKGVKPVR
ncbi:myo-inositol 2-dehydrogenase / D-chiro-inositol 1-dehydrogenase [Micromonospora phaseoli]|uniref:Myo-inositol 2-dehydrogenase / D-chiro-inositol 1-dehydrogenase n=1 Tax=Micromonospora phaseoli TaxID=1144548 RepID=A0A1H7DYU9_9ACTN|nr:Gfo/Idh/MocA family oxidoreductase [Micromonospora phaseoli]PZV99193.1 myo-inositol 2-dehydrogenase/D-chiro-inositol 1-dehydrogenase [Micromonospora phaseoli]GIJ80011.1 inositol 2-dehydrogenase [Micromonospora phaseoli]SEK04852.1 myo-inositol 2-dehydrogenase / D-chiro-inositol 1-dehydrogenase [Micromonospora phaseoli]